MIPAGIRPIDPTGSLSGPRFAELLNWARSKYDQVLIDTPPILAASDANNYRSFGGWLNVGCAAREEQSSTRAPRGGRNSRFESELPRYRRQQGQPRTAAAMAVGTAMATVMVMATVMATATTNVRKRLSWPLPPKTQIWVAIRTRALNLSWPTCGTSRNQNPSWKTKFS